MSKNLNRTHAHLRRDYQAPSLSENTMKASPMQQFSVWFNDSVKRKIVDANAFVLATADKNNRPSGRVLLMKAFNARGITFFTNYSSNKGKALQANPFAEAVFYWGSLSRQVRLSGRVVRVSKKESLEYFRSRPLMAQYTESISDQSRIVSNKDILIKSFAGIQKKMADECPTMPDDWGGYELRVEMAEFWQGQPNRLHDRLCYKKSASGRWTQFRLQP